MVRSSLVVLCALLAWADAARSQPVRLPWDGIPGAHFGTSLGHDHHWLLVGVPGAREARLFVRSEEWKAVERLLPPRSDHSIAFGREVAIDGSIAAVADPFDEEILPEAGAVHIYERAANGRWRHVTKIHPPRRDTQQLWFGGHLDLQSDTLFVGAAGFSGAVERQGAVFVFARHHGGKNAWGLAATLTAPDARPHDALSVVASNGRFVVAGAPNQVMHARHGGTVYVFERAKTDSAGWHLAATLVASDGAPGDRFGSSVAVYEDAIVVGAPGVSNTTGKAYLFRRVGGTWKEMASFAAPDGRSGDEFGASVGLGEHGLGVGAPGHRGDGGYYVYEWTNVDVHGSGPTKVAYASGTGTENFGRRGLFAGDRLLVSAPGASHKAGAVYDFDLSDTTGAAMVSFDHLIAPQIHEEKYHVEALLEDRYGFLWVGSAGGIARHDGYESVHFRHDPRDSTSIPSGAVLSMLEDDGGRMWIGTENGLARFDHATGRFVSYRLDGAERSRQSIRVLFEDREGAVWTGTNGRIYRYDADRDRFNVYRPFTGLPDSLDETYMSGIQQDRDGRLWVLSKNLWKPRASLYRIDLDREDIRRFAVPEAWGWVGPLFIDSRDRLWLKMPAPVDLPAEGDSVSGPSVSPENAGHWSFHEDESGTIWAATREGLYRLRDGATAPTTHRIKSADHLANSVWALFSDSAGRLLLGTDDGVYAVSNSPAGAHTEPEHAFPLALTAVNVASAEGSRAVTPYGLDRLDLSYRDYHLSLDYAALTYDHPDGIQYRYRLDGFDKDWIDAGEVRRATYTRLPPGRYIFQAEAVPREGIPSVQAFALPITVAPPYWQTWWFRLAVLGAIAGLLAAAYKYRVRQLLAMERLRLRLATDLHDDLSSDLSGIALVTDVLIRRGDIPAEDHERLNDVLATSLRMLDSLRDLVWYINPEHDTLEDLTLRMKATAGMLLNGTAFDFSDETSLVDSALPMALRRHVFLIYKEALHNISRHANATWVNVRISRAGDRLVLEVNDNGIGFEADDGITGHGLRNMKARAEAMDADFRIDSRPGIGTTVRLSVRIAKTRDGVRTGSRVA